MSNVIQMVPPMPEFAEDFVRWVKENRQGERRLVLSTNGYIRNAHHYLSRAKWPESAICAELDIDSARLQEALEGE